mmetsp:Transcript_69911/g.167817  ORF Transcript_69911/g.167817 Transcript_69911/m.167817 type:complete len:237 (-) Transcript_69911:77-787(-)
MAWESSMHDLDDECFSATEYPFYSQSRSILRGAKKTAHPRSPSEAAFGTLQTASEARLARWCVQWPHLWDCYAHDPDSNDHPRHMQQHLIGGPASNVQAASSVYSTSESWHPRMRATSSTCTAEPGFSKQEKLLPPRLISQLRFKENEDYFKQTLAKVHRARSLGSTRSDWGHSTYSHLGFSPVPSRSRDSKALSRSLPELRVGLVNLGRKKQWNDSIKVERNNERVSGLRVAGPA